MDLRSVVARAVEDVHGFRERGLWFSVTDVVPRGRPLEALEVRGVLHFLPGGRFCCGEPGCYLEMNPEVADAVRRALGLRQPLTIVWRGWIGIHHHDGVRFPARP